MKSLTLNTIIVIILCTIGSACTNENEYAKLLPGTWKAYDFTQNGESVDFDLSRLSFTFDNKGNYSFMSSNLSTKEAGPYHLNNNILYTTDTLASQRLEKAVKIEKVSIDTIQFLMNAGGIDQKIFLYRSK
jgi:hypothetical protein